MVPHDLRSVHGAVIRSAGAEPEVREVAVLLTRRTGEQDVRRLDIAVHEPVLVCGIERGGDWSTITSARSGASAPSARSNAFRSVPWT
jgi:hypothetical protein